MNYFNHKKQKLAIYKLARKTYIAEEIENPNVGICYHLDNAVRLLGYENINGYSKMKLSFPEIYSQKPSHLYDGVYWWSLKNTKKRIAVFDKAIQLLEE